MEDDDGAQPSLSPKKEKAAAHPFRLRVALRCAPSAQQSTDDEDEDGGEKRTNKRDVHRTGKTSQAKKKRHVKFEDEETAVARPSPSEKRGSGSAEDVSDSFLAKREQNIKANKAMVTRKHKTKFSTQRHRLLYSLLHLVYSRNGQVFSNGSPREKKQIRLGVYSLNQWFSDLEY